MIPRDLDLEDFPNQMARFAHDIIIFLECLNELQQFADEAVNASIYAFWEDLQVGLGSSRLTAKTGLADACCGVVLGIVPWSIYPYANYQAGLARSALIVTPDQFRYPAVQRYLHDLSSDLGEHIESITSALSLLIEAGKLLHFTSAIGFGLPYSNVSGVPTIQFSQEHGAHSLLNLSTIATFFSSVTATSMQFSFSDTSGVAANVVNAFWFTSLVFSIGGPSHCMRKDLSVTTLSSRCRQQSAGVNLEAGHIVRFFVIIHPLF